MDMSNNCETWVGTYKDVNKKKKMVWNDSVKNPDRQNVFHEV